MKGAGIPGPAQPEPDFAGTHELLTTGHGGEAQTPNGDFAVKVPSARIPGIEGVSPSCEGKMPSIPGKPALRRGDFHAAGGSPAMWVLNGPGLTHPRILACFAGELWSDGISKGGGELHCGGWARTLGPPRTGWCGRGDSNPQALADSGF